MTRQRALFSTKRWNHRRSVEVGVMALVAFLLAITISPKASAQKIDTNQFVMTRILVDTAWARRPTFGIDSNDFWFGGVFATREPGYQSGSVGNIWSLARWLGLKIIEQRRAFDETGYTVYDGLIDAAIADSNERVIVGGGRLAEIGWAREIILYPFDSSQSYYWQSIFRLPEFASRPGSDTLNAVERDYWEHPSRERVYQSGNTTAGATILSRVAFGYDSVYHLRRYPSIAYDENFENTTAFFERNDLTARAAAMGPDHALRSRYFAVRGHLFEGGAASDTDTLLLLDIYNEIPKGTTYLNSSGVVTSNPTQDVEILYTTVPVLKADLKPIRTDYNKYVEKTINIDLARLQPTSGMGGPLNPDNTAHRFDLRVRWTGKEKVALRSIHLRDSIAELLIGTDPTLNTLRHDLRLTLESEADRIMRGVDFQQDTIITNAVRDARMQKILRFYTGDEGLHIFTGLNYLDSFLYRRFPNLSVDTLTRGMRAFRAQPGSQGRGAELLHGTAVTEQEIAVELYPFEGPDIGADDSTYAGRFGLPPHIPRIPSISEHNGGRFGIPLLNISSGNVRDSVDIFSRAMQRQSFGAYAPGGYMIWPLLTGINNIGHAASVARRTGRRLIVWPGVMTNLRVLWQQTGENQYQLLDTQFSHQPEVEDQKMIVNLTLAYGGSGIHLSWVGSDTNEFGSEYKHLGGDTVLYNYGSDLGLVGQFTSDTTNDVLSPYVLGNTSYLAAHRVEIPNFWTGWQSRSRGMRWLTKTWIPKLWPTLRRLHWRDAYSIHFTALQTWFNPSTDDLKALVTRQRSIKAGEIISKIEAYGRDDTLAFTRLDSATNTFIEVGLFDKLSEVSSNPDPYNDTNYIMLVNRRTFARGADIDSTSERGRTMDSLAEWRRVVVYLNIPRRDPVSYTFVRIREISHDPTPLPFSNETPQEINTVVANYSRIEVIMAPGSGTLLEVTYLMP